MMNIALFVATSSDAMVKVPSVFAPPSKRHWWELVSVHVRTCVKARFRESGVLLLSYRAKIARKLHLRRILCQDSIGSSKSTA